MLLFRNGVSPVVSVLLLLLISVIIISVLLSSLQNYSSSQIEQTNVPNGDQFRVVENDDTFVLINNPYNNISIESIELENSTCSFDNTLSYDSGIIRINLSDCMSSSTLIRPRIEFFTEEGIFRDTLRISGVDENSCSTPEGAIVRNLESQRLYSNNTVPYGDSCNSISQIRTCSNGVLDGDTNYTYGSCSVAFFDCFDYSNIGFVGPRGVCEDMLVVNRAMLDGALDLSGGIDKYITHNGINYTFGDSANNVFTGQVTDMSSLFQSENNFNANIGYWDTQNVISMERMFYQAYSFDQYIGSWDVGNVTNMREMFRNANLFNNPIENWNVSNVNDMGLMFRGTDSFNQNLSLWDMSSVTSTNEMFRSAVSFNGNISWENTSSLSSMIRMFQNADSFNQPIDNWDISGVSSLWRVFRDAHVFNQSLNSWNTINIRYMNEVFYGASAFNQDLDLWDTSNVDDMREMFNGANSFNQPLNTWNTSSVEFMGSMFRDATSFNQPLNNWNTSSVQNMVNMFRDTVEFDQDISMWDMSQVSDCTSFDSGSSGSWTTGEKPDLTGC